MRIEQSSIEHHILGQDMFVSRMNAHTNNAWNILQTRPSPKVLFELMYWHQCLVGEDR